MTNIYLIALQMYANQSRFALQQHHLLLQHRLLYLQIINLRKVERSWKIATTPTAPNIYYPNVPVAKVLRVVNQLNDAKFMCCVE